MENSEKRPNSVVVTQEDYFAAYGSGGHLEYSHVHAKLHCRERQLREALAQLTLLREGRDQNGGWISVETEMPPSNEDVLVRWGVPEQSTDVAMYLLGDDEWWCNARGAYLHRITHWQPIQPPLIEAQTPEMEAK